MPHSGHPLRAGSTRTLPVAGIVPRRYDGFPEPSVDRMAVQGDLPRPLSLLYLGLIAP